FPTRSPPSPTLLPYTTLFRSLTDFRGQERAKFADGGLALLSSDHGLRRRWSGWRRRCRRPSPFVGPDGLGGSGFVQQFYQLDDRSEEHTSELQSRFDLVCRLL